VKLPMSWEHFNDPWKAARDLGQSEAIAKYKAEVEPRYRDVNLSGYPKDWIWRKFVKYVDADGMCNECKKHGSFEQMNAHHRDRSTHALSNLELLHEWPCHRKGRHGDKRKRS